MTFIYDKDMYSLAQICPELRPFFVIICQFMGKLYKVMARYDKILQVMAKFGKSMQSYSQIWVIYVMQSYI